VTAAGRTRRSVLVAPRRCEVEEAGAPSPGPGEVLVEVLLNGICASEVELWSAGPPAPPTPAETVLGHEPVGRVVALGAGVAGRAEGGLAEGDLVAGRLTSSFADLVVARAEDAVRVPEGVPLQAAMAEPLGCVVEALRRTRVDVGDRVAVVGLGFMGLCLLQLLALEPLAEVVGVDPREESRAHALAHGASRALAPEEALADGGLRDGVDVVFEVTGVQAGLDLATSLSREHGALTITGYHQGVRQVDAQQWNWKALDVVNGHVRDSRRLAESTRRGLALVAAGRLDYGALFTHRYALGDVDDGYRALVEKPPGFVKAYVDLRDDDR
jgi:threonine dehydrogenase-like Zn-dependent dehydrogenase